MLNLLNPTADGILMLSDGVLLCLTSMNMLSNLLLTEILSVIKIQMLLNRELLHVLDVLTKEWMLIQVKQRGGSMSSMFNAAITIGLLNGYASTEVRWWDAAMDNEPVL